MHIYIYIYAYIYIYIYAYIYWTLDTATQISAQLDPVASK